jgi:hypothetical protein
MRQGPFMDFKIVPSKAREADWSEKRAIQDADHYAVRELMSVWKGTISAANGGAKLAAGPA